MQFLNPGKQQLRVTMLNFVETGTFNPMHYRPYATDMNDSSLSAIATATNFGTNVSAQSLSPVVGMFMRPTAQASGEIAIPNGWNTPRLRFVMQLEYPAIAGGRIIQYVTGFTNKSDLSYSRQLDPNMMLYFNNSLLMQEISEMTPMGLQTRLRMVSADQVLSAEAFGIGVVMPGGSMAPIRTMRPEDVFSVIGTDKFRGLNGATDLRPTFLPTTPVKKSTRKNNSFSDYLARSIDGFTLATENSDWDTSGSENFNKASALVAEESVMRDNFLAWVQARGLMTSGGSVPWGELIAAAPEADHVAKVLSTGAGPQIVNAPMAGSTEYWSSTTHETIFATILSETVPSMMMDHLIGKFSIKCTNRHPELFGLNGEPMGAQHSVHVLGGFLLNQQPIDASLYRALVMRIASVILPEVSMAGMIDYEFTGHFDLLGTSMLSVSISGQPAIDFTVPTFADNLFTPVMTANPESLSHMASDLSVLVTRLQDAGVPQTAPIANPYGF